MVKGGFTETKGMSVQLRGGSTEIGEWLESVGRV